MLRSKERCLLIHDDFHEDFDAVKFSRRFKVKGYKMTIVTTVINALRNILDNINETKNQLILLHVGNKDFSIGYKVVDVTNDLKHTINWLMERSLTKV